MNKNLPIYDVVINDDEQGVSFISLVDEPAIQVDWIKLAEEEQMSFAADQDKQLLYGPFLIPDKLIYRYSDKMGEYYVRFKKEEIEKIARKFNSDLNNNNLNFQHSDKKVDATVVENWLVAEGKDKSMKFGFDLAEGTWFGGVYIKDSEFWNEEVKTEKVKGFSVEVLAELELALKKINTHMEKEIKLASATLIDGETIVYYDGELAVGTAIWMDEAMSQPAPDADHILADGTKVTTVGGLVTEIEAPETVVEEAKKDEKNKMADVPTYDQVSEMIDSRYSELINEITALKKEIEAMKGTTDTVQAALSQVKETLSNTPATTSISDKKEVKAKLAKDFDFALERVKSFAKGK